MGYHTDFEGQFDVTPALRSQHRLFLIEFSHTLRVRRDEVAVATMPDPVRVAAGLPVGPDGCNFVGGLGFMGQDHDASFLSYAPPGGQPGSWCQWVPSEDGCHICWDQGEKFYDYIEWLVYVIEHYLKPWGYHLNGEVEWFGSERGDLGKIVVADNVVTVLQGRVTYG